MKKWFVRLPIAGYVTAVVEAEGQEAAIDAALSKDYEAEDIEEWEVLHEIVRGNVCSAPLTRADAEPEG